MVEFKVTLWFVWLVVFLAAGFCAILMARSGLKLKGGILSRVELWFFYVLVLVGLGALLGLFFGYPW